MSDIVLGIGGKEIGMEKKDEFEALLDRAKELKEIGEKLMKESDQLMEEYEARRLKKRGRARRSSTFSA